MEVCRGRDRRPAGLVGEYRKGYSPQADVGEGAVGWTPRECVYWFYLFRVHFSCVALIIAL